MYGVWLCAVVVVFCVDWFIVVFYDVLCFVCGPLLRFVSVCCYVIMCMFRLMCVLCFVVCMLLC